MTRAIVNGSEIAFEQFYGLYSARLFRWVVVMVRGDEETGREVHQMVMIKAARGFKVFKREDDLWAWLRRLARNAFIDYLRRRSSRAGELPLDASAISEARVDSVGNQIFEWLEEGLKTLEDEERTLLQAFYYERQPQSDIAQDTSTSLKSIQSKLARIRQKLRYFIKEKLQNE